jgi:hypothetical protein
MTDVWRAIDANFLGPRVYWAGYLQVEATLALRTEQYALRRPDARQPSDVISRRYLDGILPSPLVARSPRAGKAEKLVSKLCALSPGKLSNKWRRPITLGHGCSWWALASEAASFAAAEVARRSELVAKYRRSFASDERIFHTVIGNSPFAASVTGEIPFTRRGTWEAASPHPIDPSLTRWYDGGDIAEVIASDCYFVRKASSDRSGPLLDALDAHAARLEAKQSRPAGDVR